MKIKATKDYEKWFVELTDKEQAQIIKRLNSVEKHDYLGDINFLGEKLYELRWKNGWRIYFIKHQSIMILLTGGKKNGQEKDIKKARLIMERYRRS